MNQRCRQSLTGDEQKRAQRTSRAAAARSSSGAGRSACARNRNVDYAREHFGLLISVPWSAWEGHEDSAEVQTGIVWDYDRDTRRFIVRFAPTAEWSCDDIELTCEELRAEKLCLASPWQLTRLHELCAPRMIPQPRGGRPTRCGTEERPAGYNTHAVF